MGITKGAAAKPGGVTPSSWVITRGGEMSMVSVTSTEARRLAIERCEDEAKDLGADLLIIDHLEVRDAAEIVEVSCMGTALKKVRDLVPMPMATATS